MTGNHLNPIPNLQPRRPLLPAQRPMLIPQNAIRIPWILTLRQPTIRRQRLQPSINCNSSGPLLTEHSRRNRQAMPVERTHRIPVINIHENKTARLQLRHARHSRTELGRSRPASRHNFNIEPCLTQRIRRPGQDSHRLQTLLLPVFVIVQVLQMPLVPLHTHQLQMLQGGNMSRQC